MCASSLPFPPAMKKSPVNIIRFASKLVHVWVNSVMRPSGGIVSAYVLKYEGDTRSTYTQKNSWYGYPGNLRGGDCRHPGPICWEKQGFHGFNRGRRSRAGNANSSGTWLMLCVCVGTLEIRLGP